MIRGLRQFLCLPQVASPLLDEIGESFTVTPQLGFSDSEHRHIDATADEALDLARVIQRNQTGIDETTVAAIRMQESKFGRKILPAGDRRFVARQVSRTIIRMDLFGPASAGQ